MPAGRPGYRGEVSGKSPPLSMRLRLRHWVAVDCVVAAGCGLIMVAVLYRSAGPHSLLGVFTGAFRPLPLLAAGAWRSRSRSGGCGR